MPPVGFEPMISAGERPQTYALDSAGTGTGRMQYIINIICVLTIINSCVILKITVFWDVDMRCSPLKAEAACSFKTLARVTESAWGYSQKHRNLNVHWRQKLKFQLKNIQTLRKRSDVCKIYVVVQQQSALIKNGNKWLRLLMIMPKH